MGDAIQGDVKLVIARQQGEQKGRDRLTQRACNERGPRPGNIDLSDGRNEPIVHIGPQGGMFKVRVHAWEKRLHVCILRCSECAVNALAGATICHLRLGIQLVLGINAFRGYRLQFDMAEGLCIYSTTQRFPGQESGLPVGRMDR